MYIINLFPLHFKRQISDLVPGDANNWECVESSDVLVEVPGLVKALEAQDWEAYLDLLVKMMLAVVGPMYKAVLKVR